eukprot:TRINITY_DN8757_c0_g1_i19.p1 TRINITY_DN8757_c0_g1~~TRINITY_DN8757_c0_g1_i19.p1  ORF type:complete len:133 (-),score=37.48 TRINITY_DN8757_c0_g1_i19:144-542(-)
MAFLFRRLSLLSRLRAPFLLGGLALGFMHRQILGPVMHGAEDPVAKRYRLGATVKEVSAEEAKGLELYILKENSIAEKYGLKENDIIAEVDGMAVKSFADYEKAMAKSKDKVKVFKIIRDGKAIEVKIDFTK